MEIHCTKQILRKFGIVVIIEIFSVTSQTSFNIEPYIGGDTLYNDIKHVLFSKSNQPTVYAPTNRKNSPKSADHVES